MWHLVVGVVGLGVVLAGREGVRVVPWVVGVVLVVVALGVPLLVPASLPSGVFRVSDGLVVGRSVEGFDVVVLEAGAELGVVLEGLGSLRLGRVDLLVSESGGRGAGVVVSVLAREHDILRVWAPVGHSVPGAVGLADLSGVLGSLEISQLPDGSVTLTNRSG